MLGKFGYANAINRIAFRGFASHLSDCSFHIYVAIFPGS